MSIIVVLAEGFEEIESVTPVDILRRASLDVKIVSLNGQKTVTGSRGISFVVDDSLVNIDYETIDALILPGGMPGAKNLSENDRLIDIIVKLHENKKVIAAICAAPVVVLGKSGILKDRAFTGYPGFEKDLPDAEYINEPVVITDNLVTGQGPGAAMNFALALVKKLAGEETAEKIAGTLCLPEGGVRQ